MEYLRLYRSPLGNLLLKADGTALVSLKFTGAAGILEGPACPALLEGVRWLNLYFAGRDPGFTPAVHLEGSAFQLEVWRLLLEIPYGRLRTYGAIAADLARRRGGRMAARAVGAAVGKNPLELIVPCHRVVGRNGNLVGYAGGLDRKARLIRLEQGAEAGLGWPE